MNKFYNMDKYIKRDLVVDIKENTLCVNSSTSSTVKDDYCTMSELFLG